MDDFAKRFKECITTQGGLEVHSVLKKWTVYVSDLNSKIVFFNVSVYIIYSMKQNLHKMKLGCLLCRILMYL
jgi:hypothetical protein